MRFVNAVPCATKLPCMITCILIAVILLATAGNVTASEKNGKSPRATCGVFDLQGYPLAKGEAVALDGEWEFFWGRLLTPEDFQLGQPVPESSGYMSLPGRWTSHKSKGQALSGTGQATFRLRLLPAHNTGRLSLRLFDIHEAYKLWANGVLVAQSGVPGISAETEVPVRSLHLAELALNGHPIELILQVSNHHFRFGGVTDSIMVALPGTLEKFRARDWGLALFFAGCMLIMGVYHLFLFFLQKRDPAPLYFGLYCLLVVGYSITSNTSQWVASVIFPWWPPASMEIFSLACFVMWPSLLFRFLKELYPDEFHSWLHYLLDARIVIFFCLQILAPGVPLYWFIALCLLQTMVFATYYLHRLVLCIRRGRSGAKFLLIGLAMQFLAGLNDSLTHFAIIQSIYLAEPAVCLFVLTQSMALAARFSVAFDSVERLSVELEHKNEALQFEMEERNRLGQKVVSISEEERRRISHELHDGLCQQLTGARLRASALAHKYAGSDDAQALAELADLLNTSTDDAYRTSRGLWPVEHDTSQAGPSLESLVRSITKATGIKVTFEKEYFCKKCMNPNVTPLYRIAQEALTNAVKHSQSHCIQVRLICHGDGKIKLSVQDDGIGYDVATSKGEGLGTSIMAHRAKIIDAELHIISFPQSGTYVSCAAPCSVLTISNQNSERSAS